MPIYEYECQECSHAFDALQKMSDAPLTDCPECGKPELRKLISAPNFRLKGGGWYETDFKKDNQRNLAGDAAAKDAGGGKDSDATPGKSDKKDGGSDKPAKTTDKQTTGTAGGAASTKAAAGSANSGD